ncbi:MAG: hypothetical protein QOJ79_749 [Actinomycetota bacterium]|jgi:hypothetical protein|nr:hypothetical protein [Actinomycetota bacterium]
MRHLRLLALLPVLAAPLLLAGAAQAATTPSDVAQALRSDPVFVEPDAEHAADVDADKVRSQVRSSSHQVLVAVLPQRAADKLGSARTVAIRIAELTPRSSVLVALVGDELVAVAGPDTPFGAGEAQDRVGGVSGGATDRLVEAVRNLQSVSGASSNGGNSSAGGDTGNSGGGHGLLWLILGVLGVGGGAYVFSKRRGAKRDMEGLRADVESLYNRLGSDISTIPGGDDAVAKQALSDAAERYNATGALLAHADTPGEFAAARRTAVEGLVAAQTARKKLGLDPGPEIPLPPGQGPQLIAEQKVRVGDQEYEGSPTYQPGRGHYYGGGYYNGQVVPGGWYAFPFWETMLMTSVLTGGFGGGGMFGGGGYERGYEEGRDDARDDSGGGGLGGGDWGGGGGDWGGGGGGDWGGGGGGGGDGGGW